METNNMAGDIVAVKNSGQTPVANQEQATKLFNDALQNKFVHKDFAGAKQELDDCVSWGEKSHNKSFLTESLFLRAIVDVDLKPPGTGSQDAEADFKKAAENAKTLPNFDLVRFGELEQQRGANLRNLNRPGDALTAYQDGLAALAKSPDADKPLSPATDKKVELLYDIGVTDEQTKNFSGATTSLSDAARAVRTQLRVQVPNSPAFKAEWSRFSTIMTELQSAYDKQGVDGAAKVAALKKTFECEENPGCQKS
jgi:hypothetical protein